MPDRNKTLLQIKLHRPRVTRNLVLRPRLFERLNDGLQGDLTLVCAAAGYGKSTLVSSWIESLADGSHQQSDPLPAMWLSLDENDSDLTLFIRYFIAALQTHFPETGVETLEQIQTVRQPPLALLVNTLSNEISRMAEDFILVLDDYSSLRGPEVDEFLNALLLHWPTPMHLVLITRTNPSLPLANLRAWGKITEIRSKDLRFSEQDFAAYMSKMLPKTLDGPALALLEQQTDGWIAGLQLAALSLRTAEDPDAFLASLSGSNTEIADYLIDGVLLQQPPVIQKFLLRTSILKRFSADLCQVLVGDDEPNISVIACMDWVERANLFIIPLDNRQEWYRYHHLFQDLLQMRLRSGPEADLAASLHQKAAKWFVEHGSIDEAIYHALQANDFDLAGRLMTQGLHEVLNREDIPTLKRWLRLLPDDLIQSRPGLLMFKAWDFYFNTQIGTQSQYVRQVEALLNAGAGEDLQPEELRVLRGQIGFMYGQEAFHSNEMVRAATLFQETLSLLPETWVHTVSRTVLMLGASMHASGQGIDAERFLLDKYEAQSDKNGSVALGMMLALGINLFQDGELQQAANYFETVLRQSVHNQLAIIKHWALIFLAQARFHLNDLDASRQHLAEIINHRYLGHISTYRQALVGLALIDQIGNRPTEAWNALEQLSRFDLEQYGRETPVVQSLRARLWLLQGDLESASKWADGFLAPLPEEPLLWLETPHLTKARVLLARDAPGDIQLAQSILETLGEITGRIHNIRSLIEILAMRAVALHTQGKTGASLSALEKAIQLAHAGGSRRAFVDLGPRMLAMLKELARQGKDIPDIRHILAAFPPEDSTGASSTALLRRVPNAVQPPVLIEPLTARELDILVLLSQRLSNKEIGQKLNITSVTVKRHILNIFQKLGVNRRADAVARATVLGIIATP
jgi:LuxR family transcriptional regulator, maltose regulon positive regulatory protein